MQFTSYKGLYINVDNICTLRIKTLKNDYGFYTLILSINGIDYVVYHGLNEKTYNSEYSCLKNFIADIIANSIVKG